MRQLFFFKRSDPPLDLSIISDTFADPPPPTHTHRLSPPPPPKHTYHIRTPKRVAALCDEVTTHVAAGALSSAAVTVNGSVYTWGYGDGGSLGHGLPALEEDEEDEDEGNDETASSEAAVAKASKQRDLIDGLHNEVLPVQVGDLDGHCVTAVAMGGGHSIFLCAPEEELSSFVFSTLQGREFDTQATFPISRDNVRVARTVMCLPLPAAHCSCKDVESFILGQVGCGVISPYREREEERSDGRVRPHLSCAGRSAATGVCLPLSSCLAPLCSALLWPVARRAYAPPLLLSSSGDGAWRGIAHSSLCSDPLCSDLLCSALIRYSHENCVLHKISRPPR